MKDEMSLHNSNKLPFFEGYYYKVATNEFSLAIIVGFSITEEQSVAFLQCYNTKTNQKDYLVYDYNDFYYDVLSDTVYLKNNYFGKDEVYIEDERLEYTIHYYLNESVLIDSTFYTPTIMGPFHYIPFMQCNHAVISLRNNVLGQMCYKDEVYQIDGIGYIEKDWGSSFPKEYLWVQSNHSIDKKGNLFLASGHIPFKVIDFMGTIGIITINDKTYRIGSYYGAKVIERTIIDETSIVIIKQGMYLFTFKLRLGTTCEFLGPIEGVLKSKINESLDSNCSVRIYKRGKLKEEISFIKCGMEIIDFMK